MYMRHFRRKHREVPRDDGAMVDGLSAQAVASLPPPGLSGPSQPIWSPNSSRYLAFINSTVQAIRQLSSPPTVYQPLTASHAAAVSIPQNNGGSTASYSRPSCATVVTTSTTVDRTLFVLDLESPVLEPRPLLSLGAFLNGSTKANTSGDTTSASDGKCLDSLEERLRRERQRLSSGSSLTQFEWAWLQCGQEGNAEEFLRLLVPVKGSLYVQDGVLGKPSSSARCIHEKSHSGNKAAVDAQLSPDATMVVWASDGELYCKASTAEACDPAIQLTFGAERSENVCISHGVADFVAQEEMDRYTGAWWNPNSRGIMFARVDESSVPIFRIVHYPSPPTVSSDTAVHFEDHRYPFAGKKNPSVRLGYIRIDRDSVLPSYRSAATRGPTEIDGTSTNSKPSAADIASQNWTSATWFDAPSEASEYLARVYWLPDGNTVISQWQNRAQDMAVLYRMDVSTGKGHVLLTERSKFWINLHDMLFILPYPIHPDACSEIADSIPFMPPILPTGSFSFLFASERTGFSHIYLYTYVPGVNGEQAILIRAVSAGDWMVEHIVGADVGKDTVYLVGTFDSVLERHLYALPLTNRSGIDVDVPESYGMNLVNEDPLVSSDISGSGMRKSINKVIHALSGKPKTVPQLGGKTKKIQNNPLRLTSWSGMHTIVMDSECRYFVDVHSDIDRPTTVAIYQLQCDRIELGSHGSTGDAIKLVKVLFAAENEDKSLSLLLNKEVAIPQRMTVLLPAPEFFSLPTLDGAETLYAALYRPDPQVHGPGPYPLICAVYGGPHVQRVNRSWAQCADMRAQRLRKLGFCVVKCDNRGSSRRGVAFESAIHKTLGRVEVLDQIAVVRHLVVRGIADGTRVGVYGWSYGGYLATMCLCRAPDVFHVAVAGAPVSSWDGYDTHYTERYLGLPSENSFGYQESAVFDHVQNMCGKLMIVHGLIDENVHFRHSSRLINKLTNAGKDYELLVFPDERHSPRRLRDRIYMEQRISDFFVQHLSGATASQVDIVELLSQSGMKRHMAGSL